MILSRWLMICWAFLTSSGIDTRIWSINSSTRSSSTNSLRVRGSGRPSLKTSSRRSTRCRMSIHGLRRRLRRPNTPAFTAEAIFGWGPPPTNAEGRMTKDEWPFIPRHSSFVVRPQNTTDSREMQSGGDSKRPSGGLCPAQWPFWGDSAQSRNCDNGTLPSPPKLAETPTQGALNVQGHHGADVAAERRDLTDSGAAQEGVLFFRDQA